LRAGGKFSHHWRRLESRSKDSADVIIGMEASASCIFEETLMNSIFSINGSTSRKFP
jgi:hypothetical protein